MRYGRDSGQIINDHNTPQPGATVRRSRRGPKRPRNLRPAPWYIYLIILFVQLALSCETNQSQSADLDSTVFDGGRTEGNGKADARIDNRSDAGMDAARDAASDAMPDLDSHEDSSWFADADSLACDNHWTGAACLVCPYNDEEGYWDKQADCATCAPGYTGERCTECRVYVNAAVRGDVQNGQSWETAFKSLSQGIEAAKEGLFPRATEVCDILVARGTYEPEPASDAAEADPRAATFNLMRKVYVRGPERYAGQGHLRLFGGYKGDESCLDLDRGGDWPGGDDDCRVFSPENETILSGASNVYHVVTGGQDAELDGFTIADGRATGGGMDDQGGGLLVIGEPMVLRRIVFRNNSAAERGGAIYAEDAQLELERIVFQGNEAEGGSAVHASDGSVRLHRATVYGNGRVEELSDLAAIHASDSATIRVERAVIWNNRGSAEATVDNQRSADDDSHVYVFDSDLQGSGGEVTDDPRYSEAAADPSARVDPVKLVDLEPWLVDPSAYELYPTSWSPLLDPFGEGAIGAYDYRTCRIYVAADSESKDPDGSDWGDALATIEQGIDEASSLITDRSNTIHSCDVWVKVASYQPSRKDGADAFILATGVGLYGGFMGNESALDQRVETPRARTILRPADDSNRIMTAHEVSSATLDGFTLMEGCAENEDASIDGAGLYITDSSLRLNRLSFADNEAVGNGGAIFIGGDHPGIVEITRTEFYNNQAENGAALFIANDSLVRVTRTTAFGNRASQPGSAAFFLAGAESGAGRLEIERTILWGNQASGNSLLGSQASVDNGELLLHSTSRVQGRDTDDPRFADQDSGNLHLTSWSPYVDESIGAHDYVPCQVAVASDGIFGDVANPQTSVSAGLDQAEALIRNDDNIYYTCDVWVKQGVYHPECYGPENCFEATIRLRTGVGLRGGFTGNETSLVQRQLQGDLETILDGDMTQSDDPVGIHCSDFTLPPYDAETVEVDAGPGNQRCYVERRYTPPGICTPEEKNDNVYTVVTGARHSLIEGFRIQHGWSWPSSLENDKCIGRSLLLPIEETPNQPGKTGAGMFIGERSGPMVVRNCDFVDNDAHLGAGLYLDDSLPDATVVEDCSFINNGAMAIDAGTMNVSPAYYGNKEFFKGCTTTENSLCAKPANEGGTTELDAGCEKR